MAQQFREVLDGQVKTVSDCVRVFNRIFGHIDRDQLGSEFAAAEWFLQSTAAKLYTVLDTMGKPFDEEFSKTVIAPAEIVAALADLEIVASKSYDTLCRQQDHDLAWCYKPQRVYSR